MTLKDLPIGKSAQIVSVGGEGQLRQHFLDMGLIPGVEVSVVKYAPMGDPIELKIHGYELTIRLADAEKIEIIENHHHRAKKDENLEEMKIKKVLNIEKDHPGYGEDGKYHDKKTENPLPDDEVLTFALVGNQNCGKTTLFNQLTGSNQHVGNFPGVTVDRKDGVIRGYSNTLITDLPGIYSMSPYSSEEIVTREFLLNNRPKGIINILDATNIERNLYLTMQLLELDIPMVVALNMMDELKKNDGSVLVSDLEELLGVPVVPISAVSDLEELLGVPVVPISAAKNEGIDELTRHAVHVAKYQEQPLRHDFCTPKGELHRGLHAVMHLIEDHAEEKNIPVRFAATKIVEGDNRILEELELSDTEKRILIHAVMHLIEDHAEEKNIPVRFAATKIVEGDNRILEELELSDTEKRILNDIVKQIEEETGLDASASIAKMRFEFILSVCDATVIKPKESRERVRSKEIDKFLTGKYTGIPIFIGIMGIIFWLTFNVIGSFLQGLLEMGIASLTEIVDQFLTNSNVNDALHSLIIEGIFNGVGGVLSFLPIIVTLFFFLSILEDSGYMARVAFIMDKLLRKLGLSGRSIVPMLIGFGCTVPGVMASRTLPSERDRKVTILLTPFMSCTAKLPIYAFFTELFFPDNAALVMIGLYVLGMALGIVMALLMKKTMFKGEADGEPYIAFREG